MKTYDKPQHILITEIEKHTRLTFDREAYRTAVSAAGTHLPKIVEGAIDRGRFDEDPILLTSVVPELARRVSDGEFHREHTVDVEVGHWEWVDALDPRVAPDVRERAAQERAARG